MSLRSRDSGSFDFTTAVTEGHNVIIHWFLVFDITVITFNFSSLSNIFLFFWVDCIVTNPFFFSQAAPTLAAFFRVSFFSRAELRGSGQHDQPLVRLGTGTT